MALLNVTEIGGISRQCILSKNNKISLSARCSTNGSFVVLFYCVILLPDTPVSNASATAKWPLQYLDRFTSQKIVLLAVIVRFLWSFFFALKYRYYP